MLISPFTPLFFLDHNTDGLDSPYTQVFATTDQIFLEVICGEPEETGDWILYTEPEHKELYYIDTSRWSMNKDTDVEFAVISPSPGLYSVEIGGIASDVFRVTDDPQILRYTTLIQYSMHDNRQRKDGVFFIDGMQRFFDFRVPGGFKDSNWTFGVESEQFTTPYSDIVQLYGLDSTQKKFTLGNSEGCPIWFAELLNRLLCCTYVYFNGERYARKETSVPEPTVVLQGVNSFVFSQNLQKVVNIEPTLTFQHQAILRRAFIWAPGQYEQFYRSIDSTKNRLIK